MASRHSYQEGGHHGRGRGGQHHTHPPQMLEGDVFGGGRRGEYHAHSPPWHNNNSIGGERGQYHAHSPQWDGHNGMGGGRREGYHPHPPQMLEGDVFGRGRREGYHPHPPQMLEGDVFGGGGGYQAHPPQRHDGYVVEGGRRGEGAHRHPPQRHDGYVLGEGMRSVHSLPSSGTKRRLPLLDANNTAKRFTPPPPPRASSQPSSLISNLREPEVTLHASNLPYNVDQESVRELFESHGYGEVTYCTTLTGGKKIWVVKMYHSSAIQACEAISGKIEGLNGEMIMVRNCSSTPSPHSTASSRAVLSSTTTNGMPLEDEQQAETTEECQTLKSKFASSPATSSSNEAASSCDEGELL